MNPPLNDQDRRNRDRDQIQMLSVFHFVLAGFALVGLVFLFLHYWMMSSFFLNPELWKANKNGGPPPKVFFDIFIWFYFFMGAVCLAAIILNVLSGFFLRRRKHRMFTLVIAAMNCLQIPFGTVLGIFTIIVLSRDSVREVYAEAPQPQ